MNSPDLEPPTLSDASDPEQWVEQYGDLLFGYAMSRISDRAVAEDLVQETFLAALDGRDSFAGRSQFATWLVAILRRKLIDYLRKQSRESAAGQQSLSDIDAVCFDSQGRWIARHRRWPANPDEALQQQEFEAMLEDCISRLPPPLAAAFILREREELSIDEISRSLSLSHSNVSVRLHRARLQLRQCVEHKWLGSASESNQR